MVTPPLPSLDVLVAAIATAHGCGCCGFTDDLAALVPCGDACVDHYGDGDVSHSYSDDCSHYFDAAMRRLLGPLIEEIAELRFMREGLEK